MKKCIPVILILFFCMQLGAQVQTLPEIKVSGESEIKPHLQKRNILLEEDKQAVDSLVGYLPQSYLRLPMPSITSISTARHGYLQASGNSDLGINTYLTYYPRWGCLRRLSHQLSYQIPEYHPRTHTGYQSHRLDAGIALHDSISIMTSVDYFNSLREDYETTALESSLDSHIPSINLGSFIWREFTFQTSYSNLQQWNLSPKDSFDNLGVTLSGTANYRRIDIKTKYLYTYDNGGAYLAPALPWQPWGVNGLRIALLTDDSHTIPTLEFSSRTTLDEGLSLIITQEPTLSSLSKNDQLSVYPWMHFTKAARITKTPVNLNATLELLKASASTDTSIRLIISNHLSYTLDAPIIKQSINYGVAATLPADYLQNSAGLSLLYRHGRLTLRQAIQLNLSYLTEYDYQRTPYLPMFTVDTRCSYPFWRFTFEAGFSQLYNTRDHLDDSLPEALLFDFGCEYSIKSSVIYLQIDNILDKQQYHFSEYPTRGREVVLGLKQRF